ncbi:putative sodium-coupled neutral amino acid transporter 10 [Diorhabda sublineata]|uniref:putative sodium-coupled neutral amino acid transporter 10 n=1 Tax=Diorhabda sublineata TaxID=1163346 RepID=UPI0024E181CC|nr:putative sodium-coupled neutral amino acid transporter 10 [Diorhabda sublineata]
MDTLNGHVMNLANSIIGVSVLAMPYCFKECGIILSIILLLISSIVSRLTCHYLLKSAIISRRKTFEFLAFHLFGSLGKLAIEIGMIGFLLGTCIAFFVVMGDLGPLIISEVTQAQITSTTRTSILLALALFVVLPLGLLRNIHSLNSVSKATMVFYCCLVLRIIIEALPQLFEDNWYNKVNLWRPEGLLQCIPIFSMALFCQTQLFEIYDVVPNATLDKMNNLIRHAVNFCTGVYICVGLFGYIAFVNKSFTGNILLSFEPGFISHVMKVGFIFSIAFSFPLVIFPCRASIYSCLFKEGYSVHEGSVNYIPEGKFKGLTLLIVTISLTVGILIPNIELVLSLVGSTIGVMICVLFPVTAFICVSQKNTNERLLAQFLLMVGVFVMVVGTYRNMQTVDSLRPQLELITSKSLHELEQNQVNIEKSIKKLPVTEKIEIKPEIITSDEVVKEVRHEPPQPVEPVEEEPEKKLIPQVPKKIKNMLQQEQVKKSVEEIKPALVARDILNDTKNEQVDIEAIKKEDKEELLLIEKLETFKEKEHTDEHKALIESIQKQNEVQKEIVEQQKQLLEVIKKQQETESEQKLDEVKQEKMKAVKQIEIIALKAIEKISEGEDAKKVVDGMKEGIEKSKLINPDTKQNVDNQIDHSKKITMDKVPARIKEKEQFEKNVQEVKIEVQELSSQLNEIDQNLKNKHGNDISQQHLNTENKLEPKRNINKHNDKKRNNEKPKKLTKQNNSGKETESLNPSKNGSLYLKVGASDIKISDDNNPAKLLPLPIAISNSNKKNDNTVDGNGTKKDKNKIVDNKQSSNEVQALRRDILSISTN